MTYALEISKLNKVYSNGIFALKNIDLKVKSGDFYALLGANGAGKSTMIGIISSLVQKTQGNIRIFGFDLDNKPNQAKSCIGLVPQDFNFNQFETVQQILVNQAGYYGIQRNKAVIIAEKYLNKLHLWDKHNERAGHLSGGMKRRLMIARALIHKPKLIILDEPTSGVDIELRRSIWLFLTDINKKGVTIILTTHYFEEAETLCRNIGILKNGKLIADTSIKSILNRNKSEIFILDLANNIHPCLKGFKYNVLNNKLSIEVTNQNGLNELFNQLNAQGIKILSMKNKTNRLEEIFINLINKTKTY